MNVFKRFPSLSKWREMGSPASHPARLGGNSLLLAVFGAALLTLALSRFPMHWMEAQLYDWRMSSPLGSWFQSQPDTDILLIQLDDQTSEAFGGFSPLPLDAHAKLLEELEKHSPRAIGYLVDFNQVHQIDPAIYRGPWGIRFSDSAQRIINKGVPVLLGTAFDITGELLPPYPLSAIPHALAVIHKDGETPGSPNDRVTRKAWLKLHYRPSFHADLVSRVTRTDTRLQGTVAVPEVQAEYFQFRYHGNLRENSSQSPQGPRGNVLHPPLAAEPGYPRLSFLDVVQQRVRSDVFKNKIILVGSLSSRSTNDFGLGPSSNRIPKLVMHANIVDSILHRGQLIPVGAGRTLVIAFFLFVLIIYVVLRSNPLQGFAVTAIVASAWCLGAAVAFSGMGFETANQAGLWIPMAQPLVGFFVAYYLTLPYRLVLEYRKSWDYQKRNQLLTQVEELKTNFLSLVTHDLKTPVARIQGLTEILLRKAAGYLSDKDRETLGKILASTEELNQFITQILELAKIESSELQPHFESRDLNTLIEKAAQNFKPQAKALSSRIELDLEPLFPFRMDPQLILKVLNNLIDNALKYSPRNSLIRVESRDLGDEVEVRVIDSGVGMNSEEVNQAFTKFYRAKNPAATETRGSGLGLYLTKYFVESHQGSVEVESQPGVGSTFKIRLPISTVKGKTTSD